MSFMLKSLQYHQKFKESLTTVVVMNHEIHTIQNNIYKRSSLPLELMF